MKRISWIVCICLLLSPAVVWAHGNQPGKATLNVGDGEIQIVYTSPDLNGRDINEMIKAPGANPWRLGADRATVLETPVALKIDGTSLGAGKYTLRAELDDTGKWWLQFVEDGTGAVVAKLPLEASTAGQSEEHLAIKLSGSASNASVTIQWGTQVLTGSFSAD